MKQILSLIVSLVFISTNLVSQCLTMVCPPSVTVNAPVGTCAANVVYTTPTVNCASCSSNTQTFNYTGVIQQFTVPAGITSINILARGAQGGFNTNSGFQPGLGAVVKGTFPVTPGTVLRVLVGERPSLNTTSVNAAGGNGGGGGSYVVTLANVPLIVAGGGGGSSATTDSPAKHGNITGVGGNGAAGGGVGGTGGNGGAVGTVGFQSGGGGGFFTNGGVGWSAGSDGKSYLNGGAGGLVAAWNFARGGFGGGGQGSAFVVGGGGGGYSGGGSGGNVTPGGGVGGGGSSFNSGACPSGTTGINVGHGSVVFSWGTSTVVPVLASGLASGSSFPVGTTVQTYTAQDGLGNTTSCSFSVTVSDVTSPTITCPANVNQCTAIVNGIAPNTVLDNCPGAPAVTYSFSGATVGAGVTNASGTAFNTGTTVVTYIATDGSGNTGSCSFSVVTGAAPILTVAITNTSICQGGNTSMTASGAATYTWSGGVTNGVPFSPTVTTSYTVTANSAGGCTTTAVRTITVNPLPVITTNTPAVCLGATINLTATGGNTYAWSGPLGFTSALQNPSITNAATNMSGAYTVTVTTAQGCSNTAVANVTVNTLPTPAITSNTPCAGTTLTLGTSAAVSYTWAGPNAFASNLQNPSIVNSGTIHSGVYTVTVTNAGGCRATATIAVTVNPLPVVLISSNSPVCVGKPINLNSSGGTSASWNGVGGFTSNTYSPTIAVASLTNAGNYSVTITSASGCSSVAVVSVVVNPLPVITTNTPIACLGSTINLTAIGGNTYAWSGPLGFTSALQNPSIPNAATNMSGAYTVTVTTAQGCSNTAVANVSVSVLPAPAITSNTPCAGSTLTLGTAAATSYTWTGPNAFASNLQNPSIVNSGTVHSGVYSLTITNAGGCKASGTIAVTVNPSPAVLISSNSPVCVGQVINLGSSGGTSASWNGVGGFTSNTYSPSIAIASATSAGNYSVTVIDANGCTNTTVTAVVVNALPVVVVNNPTACVNGNFNFTANGGTTYSWQGPSSFASAVQNATLGSVQAANAGQYTVTVTSAVGCTNTGVSNATVFALPNPQASNSGPLCINTTLTLTASGGANYAWAGPNGFTSLLQNPTINSVQTNAAGSYTVIVSNAQTCTNTAVTTVVINALPTPSITSNSPICEGQSVNLSATGGVSYVWSGPNGYTSNSANPIIGNALPNASGTYSVLATDAIGCQQTTTAIITVNPLPIVSITGASVCAGQNLNLGATGGNTYAWTGPNGFTSNLQNPVIPNATPAMAGIYQVTATSVNGCLRSLVSAVIVNAAPSGTVSTNAPICEFGKLQLFAGGSVSYSWTGPNGFTSNSQNPQINSASGSASGIYIVTIKDAIGCPTQLQLPVFINAAPSVVIQTSKKDGCAPHCVTYSCVTNATGTNVAFGWTLENAGTTSNLSIAEMCYQKANTYTPSVRVTDANGCTNTGTTVINVYPVPQADFNFTPNKPTLYNNTVEFTDLTNGATINQYQWYTGGNTVTNTTKNFTHTFDNIGEYLVTLLVKSDFGCTDTVSKLIRVDDEYALYIPNAFTPNEDGNNDVFQPKGSGFTKYELSIFDRWGTRLFSSNELEKGWDGTVKGRLSQDGVYVYKITLLTIGGKSKDFTGSVTLMK